MPTSSTTDKPYLPTRIFVYHGRKPAAPPSYVRPVPPEQIAPFNHEPIRPPQQYQPQQPLQQYQPPLPPQQYQPPQPPPEYQLPPPPPPQQYYEPPPLESIPTIDDTMEEPGPMQEYEEPVDSLDEVPKKGSAGYCCNIFWGLCIAALVLAAAIVPAVLLTTTDLGASSGSTTATPFVCNPSCVNGNCGGPNTCTCNTGWYGATCAMPNCTNPCLNGGNCSAPNTCICTSQWSGSTCSSPICSSPCQNNGTCSAPNVCNCTSSWNGSVCQIPVCNPSCLNGGNCTAPNTCTCDTVMWTGSICQTPVRIFWDFDNTLQDLYNNFNGIGINAPTYQSTGYNGAGTCLYLSKSLNQSVTITSPPFLNMALTSFTLQAWMNAQTLCNGTGCSDNALFGQFQQNNFSRSLHIIVRNQRIYLGFFANDVSGNLTLSPGQWYHMSYVYDYSTLTQFVYVNGYLDVSRTPAQPYQGTSGALTVGTNGVGAPNNYFDGCLDSIAYFGRAKNASEVLRDATLVAYLSFDGNTLLDSGPLAINGTGTNFSYTTAGRRNDALTLPAVGSYVQITGLRRIGTNNWPYSVAIWIYPTSLAGGTIMHLSSRTDGAQPGGWCLPIMGLTSSGQIAINSWNNSNVPVTGPAVPLNAWTHVVGTYSPTNGERLYVNGTLQAWVGGYNFMAGTLPMTITLGSSLLGTGVCNTGTIQMGRFYGALDEFYVYARELTAAEVAAHANV